MVAGMSAGNLIHLSERSSVAGSNAPLTTTTAVQVKKTYDGQAPGPICVVDDDEWVTDSITTLLETYGFSVRPYASAAQYLGDPQRDETQCLIIDQHMPGIEGLDAVAALRREALFPPTILITGRLDAAISRRADQLGVQAILEKPFPVARLVTLIRSLLDRHE
jgi:two-component system, LuxR family, response regulator FixJ